MINRRRVSADNNFISVWRPNAPTCSWAPASTLRHRVRGSRRSAQWVVDGEAPLDLWVVDIRRFSNLHRDRQWVSDRTLEAYGKHYTIGFPHEEYVTGRPRIVSPLYDRLKERRAVFGSKLGWERPNWFAPEGVEPRDVYSMGRQNWFSPVGDEHRHVREKVGIFDQSSFAKYELTGTDALKALDLICANDVSKPAGRLTYQLLNTRGIEPTSPWRGATKSSTSSPAPASCHDLLDRRAHRRRPRRSIDVTEQFGAVADGPNARKVLEAVTGADVSNQASVRPCPGDRIADTVVRCRHLCRRARLGTARADRGDRRVFDALMAAGKASARWATGRWDRSGSRRAIAPGLRHHAQRHAVRGRAGLDRQAPEEHRLPARRKVDGAALTKLHLHGRRPDVVLLGREAILRDGNRSAI
jgi:4-methylaminobutanoate oxidase (formaldehyde-forming)